MILGITVANMNGEKATIDKLLLRAFIKITGSFVGIIGFIIFVGCFLVLGEKNKLYTILFVKLLSTKNLT